MRVSNFTIIAVVVFVPLLLVTAYLLQDDSPVPISLPSFGTDTITIGRIVIPVEVADTEEARIQGLGGRDSLPSRAGMLFVFEEEGAHGIWMRNMRFPIDIIWISKDLRVVDIRENVQPDSFPSVFHSREPSLYIVETNTLFVEQNGILIGDEVEIPSKYRRGE